MFLDENTFKVVVANSPLISIDLLVKNSQGQYLLGYRKNRPAKGYWFVPGGRIFKDESIDEAFYRLTNEELGVGVSKKSANFLGPFEHFYDDHVFGIDHSTHYVVLGYELNMELDINSLPKEQHNRYAWFSYEDLLSREDVHKHSKWYLENINA